MNESHPSNRNQRQARLEKVWLSLCGLMLAAMVFHRLYIATNAPKPVPPNQVDMPQNEQPWKKSMSSGQPVQQTLVSVSMKASTTNPIEYQAKSTDVSSAPAEQAEQNANRKAELMAADVTKAKSSDAKLSESVDRPEIETKVEAEFAGGNAEFENEGGTWQPRIKLVGTNLSPWIRSGDMALVAYDRGWWIVEFNDRHQTGASQTVPHQSPTVRPLSEDDLNIYSRISHPARQYREDVDRLLKTIRGNANVGPVSETLECHVLYSWQLANAIWRDQTAYAQQIGKTIEQLAQTDGQLTRNSVACEVFSVQRHFEKTPTANRGLQQ